MVIVSSVWPAGPVRAAMGGRQALVENSPFGSTSSESAQVAAGAAAVEFRGYVVEEGVRYFALAMVGADPHARCHWMQVGERQHGYVLEAFDAATETITVRAGVGTVVVSLKHARVQLVPVTVNPTENLAPPGRADSALPPVPGVATPESKPRVEAVVAEIGRRRALRERLTSE